MSAAATRPMREKIAFNEGAPVVVSLEYTDGTEVDGKGGPQWRYFLKDDKIMWVDPPVHALIQKLTPRAGEYIAITKLKAGNRNKWEVVRVQDEPLDAQLTRSIASARNTTDARARAELAPPPPLAEHFPERRPSREYQLTADEVREANERAHRITPAAAAIAAALMAAIDGARAAEQYATSIGFNLKFTAADIRALANTSQIGEQR